MDQHDSNFEELLRNVAGARQMSARYLSDEIEHIADEIGLEYAVRGRFTGRNGREARADIIIGDPQNPAVVIAVAGFDAPGRHLTEKQQEIVELARVHLPTTRALGVIDGMGWARRLGDLRRVHQLRVDGHVDGLYTRATLDQFRDQLRRVS